MNRPPEDPSVEPLLAVVRQAYDERDPVPPGLVEMMQTIVRAEVSGGLDFDYELLTLVERSAELSGTRSAATGSAYTLQFTHGDVELLVRVAGEEEPGSGGRLDGWVAPVDPMTVRCTRLASDRWPDAHGEREWTTEVDARGRFELTGLPPGLFRLWLTPAGPSAPGSTRGSTAFATPTFEL